MLTSSTFLTVVDFLDTLLAVVTFLDAESCLCNYADGTVRVLGRKGVDVLFVFELDALLDEEGLGKVK